MDKESWTAGAEWMRAKAEVVARHFEAKAPDESSRVAAALIAAIIADLPLEEMRGKKKN